MMDECDGLTGCFLMAGMKCVYGMACLLACKGQKMGGEGFLFCFWSWVGWFFYHTYYSVLAFCSHQASISRVLLLYLLPFCGSSSFEFIDDGERLADRGRVGG